MESQESTELTGPGTHKGQPFFRRLDWLAFWAATVLSFAVYFYTLPPTVTLEDAGELAVAGDFLGVPHPPGYPIWTLLAWFFTKVFSFVTYLGQPNPAWSIALMSAVFGALACGATAMLICRSGSDMLGRSKLISRDIAASTHDMICCVGGIVGSLLFAFTPVMWSQSVIVEVYSLNAFFLILIFLFSYRWLCQPTDKLLCLTAFIFGLGLTNYQVLVLAGLALVAVVVLRDMALFRDFLITGVPFAVAVLLIRAGVIKGIVHPTHASCFIYVSLNFVVLALAYFLLPRGKTVALAILCLELGVAFYAYMPIVSDMRNPPMNWGYPRTWHGFKHALTRGQYEKIKPTDVFSLRFIHQLGAYLSDLRGQFTLPIALLGFLPFTAWRAKVKGRRIEALLVAIVLSLLASLVVVLQKVVFPEANVRVDKFLVGGVIILLAAGGVAIFVAEVEDMVRRLLGRTGATVAERVTAGFVVFGFLVLLGYYLLMLGVKVGEVTAPLRASGAEVAAEKVSQIVGQTAGIAFLMVAPLLFVGLLVWLMRGRCEFRVSIDQNSQKWIIATLLGFVCMSIMLIVLANPKGDIQDAFIQRVKFISSHALYAFWIGYGLIFGLAFADSLFRNNAAVKWITLGTAMALPLVPIQQNIGNRELARKVGGAEQQGHDFGWQFGNYQLRGAAAVSEELSADEEPLPNPHFPPEMGPDAVFFGGTDPGRFVPTYMIYSARVREDVYLITQNALADNTYMSVMRDLYGDRIWIPAQQDSARAFQRYVDEVKAGKRPKNAQLRIEGGRVQVSGALGVMEINGILAQMIFEHNKFRHPFYVEESYVIRWMFPYLEPHGLIMKIRNAPGRIADDRVRDDLDFWDWYARRLIDDTKFIRDTVARKSFSKLRSAIAGLYASHSRLAQAESAFQQARTLYPLSPEANFRLVQEVYMRNRRYGEAKEVMTQFGRQDPGNTKIEPLLRHLEKIEKLDVRIKALEAKRQKDGKIEVNSALELAECYLQSQRRGEFMGMINSILGQQNLPPPVFYRAASMLHNAKRYQDMTRALELCVAKMPSNAPPQILLEIVRMYASAGQPGKMRDVLVKYLERQPADWKAWTDLASLQVQLNQTGEAVRSLKQALAFGGNNAGVLIRKNPHLAPLLNRAASLPQALRTLPGLPGLPPAGTGVRRP